MLKMRNNFNLNTTKFWQNLRGVLENEKRLILKKDADLELIY